MIFDHSFRSSSESSGSAISPLVGEIVLSAWTTRSLIGMGFSLDAQLPLIQTTRLLSLIWTRTAPSARGSPLGGGIAIYAPSARWNWPALRVVNFAPLRADFNSPSVSHAWARGTALPPSTAEAELPIARDAARQSAAVFILAFHFLTASVASPDKIGAHVEGSGTEAGHREERQSRGGETNSDGVSISYEKSRPPRGRFGASTVRLPRELLTAIHAWCAEQSIALSDRMLSGSP